MKIKEKWKPALFGFVINLLVWITTDLNITSWRWWVLCLGIVILHVLLEGLNADYYVCKKCGIMFKDPSTIKED